MDYNSDAMLSYEFKLIDLPRFLDSRGSLTALQNPESIPFDIKRVFYLYEVPPGGSRGGHALKRCYQILIAISGGLDVILNDGRREARISLRRPDQGLYLPPLVWREMTGFSPGAVCLVLASEFYDAADYYRDRADFLRAVGRLQP